MDVTEAVSERESEIARLRGRVAELEAQLHDQAVRTNAIVAAAQDKTYWLDRWHLDLNALMRRRGAAELRSTLRFLRNVVWRVKRVKRRLVGY